jgi:hypothetical protein
VVQAIAKKQGCLKEAIWLENRNRELQVSRDQVIAARARIEKLNDLLSRAERAYSAGTWKARAAGWMKPLNWTYTLLAASRTMVRLLITLPNASRSVGRTNCSRLRADIFPHANSRMRWKL